MLARRLRQVLPSELGCSGQQSLWLEGSLPSGPRLAIIGSRAASRTLAPLIDLVVQEAASCGFSIVSGGAIGVDSMAHEAALALGCHQLAVLPCTRREYYPPQNAALFEAILGHVENGVLYSLPDGAQKHRRVFASRNRWIIDLATHVAVMQAAPNSGSYRTGLLAISKKRGLLAVDSSLGCRQLASKGAQLLPTVSDRSTSHAVRSFLLNLPVSNETGTQWPPELSALLDVAQRFGRAGFSSHDLPDPLFGLADLTQALSLGLVHELGPDHYVLAT